MVLYLSISLTAVVVKFGKSTALTGISMHNAWFGIVPFITVWIALRKSWEDRARYLVLGLGWTRGCTYLVGSTMANFAWYLRTARLCDAMAMGVVTFFKWDLTVQAHGKITLSEIPSLHMLHKSVSGKMAIRCIWLLHASELGVLDTTCPQRNALSFWNI